jgi:hypothetical protein
MFNAYQHSGSYDDLSKLMIRRARQDGLDNQLVEILQKFFEKELEKEHMILSRPERVRLFREVSKTILADALGKIEGADDKK